VSGSPFTALADHARHRPAGVALAWAGGELDYRTLVVEVDRLAAWLTQRDVRAVALALPNCAAWVIADLAALAAGVAVIPLPPFFSSGQARHCLALAGVEAVLTRHPEAVAPLLPPGPVRVERFEVAGEPLAWVALPAQRSSLPAAAAKVTFTSGTTGEPKGVMLSAAQMVGVASFLMARIATAEDDVHLCISPLAILLENVAGLYAPLLAGSTAYLATPEESGLSGAAGVDGHRLAAALAQPRVASAILTPGLLQAVVEAIEQGAPPPHALRFLAVGGAPVSPALLGRAEALGLPVYEGYGLSECASVVALNTPAARHSGSVGRPLPHIAVRTRADGELEVRGHGLLGYLGESGPRPGEWLTTGDLGHLDPAGYLHLTGRKKSCFITAFGRNVAPEWVERELVLQPEIAQAALFGEARPWNAAVIVPAPGATETEVATAVATANRDLPDYARVGRWLVAETPFALANGQLTASGGVRRAVVWAQYGARINRHYQKTPA